MSLITDLADAITRQEGRTQNNNPGNIWDNMPVRIWPSLPIDSRGFVIYPTPEAGRVALENDLAIKINRGMTLESLLGMYAPASDPRNDTAAYIRNVSAWTGLPADVPLNTFGGFSPGSDGTLDVASILDEISPFGGSGPEEAGVVDWGLLAVLGVGLLAIWWMASD